MYSSYHTLPSTPLSPFKKGKEERFCNFTSLAGFSKPEG